MLNIITKFYVVSPKPGKYMRLSREDDDMKDESNSISNQRKLLLGFLKKKQELADSPIVTLSFLLTAFSSLHGNGSPCLSSVFPSDTIPYY